MRKLNRFCIFDDIITLWSDAQLRMRKIVTHQRLLEASIQELTFRRLQILASQNLPHKRSKYLLASDDDVAFAALALLSQLQRCVSKSRNCVVTRDYAEVSESNLKCRWSVWSEDAWGFSEWLLYTVQRGQVDSTTVNQHSAVHVLHSLMYMPCVHKHALELWNYYHY